jgi:CheY-like chemotaxis protein
MLSTAPSTSPVLVVDDDAAIRDMVRTLFEIEAIPVKTAANGREALALLEHGLKPSLMLLDFMMPVMNGGELYTEMQRHAEWSGIPVVMFTAFGEARTPEGLTQVGKPVDLDVLLDLVRRYVAP